MRKIFVLIEANSYLGGPAYLTKSGRKAIQIQRARSREPFLNGLLSPTGGQSAVALAQNEPERLMRSAFEAYAGVVQYGVALERCVQNGDEVVVYTDDGQSTRYDKERER